MQDESLYRVEPLPTFDEAVLTSFLNGMRREGWRLVETIESSGFTRSLVFERVPSGGLTAGVAAQLADQRRVS